MNTRVFISATSKDLQQDCRPEARDAVVFCKATPVTMETWDADYLNAVKLCEQKLKRPADDDMASL